MPYRYGFLNGAGWQWIDDQTGTVKTFAPTDDALAEMAFVPRKKGAPEGDGYLIGVADAQGERPLGRGDRRYSGLAAGPVATVHMPYKVVGQVHGLWVEGHLSAEASTRKPCERGNS